MPIKHTQGIQNTDLANQKPSKNQPIKQSQHGTSNICILHGLPVETLTAVTSHLDPDSLDSLSLVNKRLHQHIKDETIWYRAFANHFLDVHPEDDLLNPEKRLLLRRTESSWRREYVVHYRLMRCVK